MEPSRASAGPAEEHAHGGALGRDPPGHGRQPRAPPPRVGVGGEARHEVDLAAQAAEAGPPDAVVRPRRQRHPGVAVRGAVERRQPVRLVRIAAEHAEDVAHRRRHGRLQRRGVRVLARRDGHGGGELQGRTRRRPGGLLAFAREQPDRAGGHGQRRQARRQHEHRAPRERPAAAGRAAVRGGAELALEVGEEVTHVPSSLSCARRPARPRETRWRMTEADVLADTAISS